MGVPCVIKFVHNPMISNEDLNSVSNELLVIGGPVTFLFSCCETV